MLESYQNDIVAGLVKKGYHVGPAAEDNSLTLHNKGNASTLIAIKVTSSDEGLTASKVNEDVRSVLTENSFLYYSVIVSACTSCCWMSSNITLPEKAQVTPPPLPTPDKSNLN
jgi:hypothetical protein